MMIPAVYVAWQRYTPPTDERGVCVYVGGTVSLAARDQMMSRNDDNYNFVVKHVDVPANLAHDDEALAEWVALTYDPWDNL